MSVSSSVAVVPCQCSSPALKWKADACILDSSSAFKLLPLHQTYLAALPPVGDVAPPLWRLLAVSFSSVAVLGSFQPAWADTVKQSDEGIFSYTRTFQRLFARDSIVAKISPDLSAKAPSLQATNCFTAEENPTVADKFHSLVWEDVFLTEGSHYPFKKNSIVAEDSQTFEPDGKSSLNNVPMVHEQALFHISLSTAEQPKPFLDFAGVLSLAKANSLSSVIHTFEAETGWRLRVITKSGSSSSISGKDLKDLWKPDEKTVIVIEDLSSPNILNFNAGTDVIVKLPRQFFLELQSRYGNQFYVQQEGEGAALISTVQAIQECLGRAEGCKNVPGLTNDLYYLTLVTSIVGGCVFGFAARLPPSGRVEASWQWVVFLSPLWVLLFVSFGVLPVVGRTSELEPLFKNTLGFCAGAVALYLTPIFGPSPISKR